MEFRYRFVDFGSVFQPCQGARPATARDDDPYALFENELAVDVGGVRWGRAGERLSVIDHHFHNSHQFPSATASVLHLAPTIQEKFAGNHIPLVWLVTHKQPDFDAFCAMYLARTVIDTAEPLTAMQDEAIDWFEPPLSHLPEDWRWACLLAAYASHLDSGRRLSCPKHRALHSVLYAALRRGRDYLAPSSGATPFFGEAAHAIRHHGFNPLFDSVLENSVIFRPELQMLDREIEAYGRDLARARRAVVHLPRWRTDFEQAFPKLQETPLLAEDGSIRPAHLAESGRLQADAIYLRDPECLLFKEWARTDTETPSMHKGFLFTAVAYSHGRPQGLTNTLDYFFAIDPERARGHHLYTLWARLESAELEAIRRNEPLRQRLEDADRLSSHTSRRTTCRIGFEDRAGPAKGLFDDPWFDGGNFACTIIATPNRGTVIGAAGLRDDLLDDPVAAIVRRELEESIYLADPERGSVQVVIRDLPAARELGSNASPLSIALDSAPPPLPSGHFRFGQIALHPDVNLFTGGMPRQIGVTLWRILDPGGSEGLPDDILHQHLIVAEGSLCVWSRRGLMVAYKPACKQHAASIEQQFASLVTLAQDVIAFAALDQPPDASAIDQAERLTKQVARTRYELTLPENRPLQRFFETTELGELLHTVRDLNLTLAERARRERLDRDSQELSANTKTVAHVQTNVEWLEVVIFSFYAAELAEFFAEQREYSRHASVIFVFAVAIVVGGMTALVLRPWTLSRSRKPAIILAAVAIALVVGIVFVLFVP